MSFSLIPIVLVIIGLLLILLPLGGKAQTIGQCLLLAGAIGVALSSGHSLTLR